MYYKKLKVNGSTAESHFLRCNFLIFTDKKRSLQKFFVFALVVTMCKISTETFLKGFSIFLSSEKLNRYKNS